MAIVVTSRHRDHTFESATDWFINEENSTLTVVRQESATKTEEGGSREFYLELGTFRDWSAVSRS